MTNVLDGIQYRTINPNLPSWNKDIYTDWIDADKLVSFPSGTQFRVKPVFSHVVTSITGPAEQKVVELRTPSKDNAMKKVSQLIEDGKAAKIEKCEIPTLGVSGLLADRNVQFKFAGQDKWTHTNYLSHGVLGVTDRVEFRIRPDLYWKVTTTGAISTSVLEFDDVESAHKYVERQLRTSDFDICITKVRYV